jgi:type II secretory pathway pseudopilin PulG
MRPRRFSDGAVASPRIQYSGVSLVEVIVAIVILGASFVPLLGLQRQHLERSRSNQRIVVAESLVRDAIEHLRWQKRDKGFDWLWNNLGDAPPTTSGISNPAGNNNSNPRIDGKYRMAVPDATGDRFDRVVRVRRRWINVPDPAITGSGDTNGGADLDQGLEDIRFLEILVTIHAPDDPVMRRPLPGRRSFYEIVTYIADFPAS